MANKSIDQLPVASTIDGSNDLLAIYTNSLTATQAINRNTYLNLLGQPAGLNDTQTLTNKTLTSPTISNPTLSGTIGGTYTLGGSPTLPSSVATLTGTQTLTNKTLTSPTINSPTITNATISADSITGYTTSNSGSIYGLTVAGGSFTALAVNNLNVSNNTTIGGNLAVTGTSTFTGTVTLPPGTQIVDKSYNPYKFSAYKNTGQNVNSGTTLVTFQSLSYDTNNNFSTSTGLYTAPVSGYYLFNTTITIAAGANADYSVSLIQNNTNSFTLFGTYLTTSINVAYGGTKQLKLNSGDTIGINLFENWGSGLGLIAGVGNTFFEGYLVSAT